MNLTYGIENTESFRDLYDTELIFPVFKRCGVIRLDGEVVGFYSLSKNDTKSIDLHSIEIVKNYRYRNIGKTFLKKLFIDNKNLETIKGQVYKEAIDFYLNLNAEISTINDDSFDSVYDSSDIFFKIKRKDLL